MPESSPNPAASPLPAAPAATSRRPRRARVLGLVALSALVLGAVAAPGVATEVSSTQLSDGHTFSEVYFPSTPPRISPNGQYAVYVQDADRRRRLRALERGDRRRHSGPAFGRPFRRPVRQVRDQPRQRPCRLYRRPGCRGPAGALQRSDRRRHVADQAQHDAASTFGYVLDFIISPTSQRVYYRADGEIDDNIELWRVDIDGGASARLNADYQPATTTFSNTESG